MPRMPVYLDDQVVELGGGPLSSILRAASDRLRPDGRIIAEVRLDGETVPAEEFETRPLPDVASADLRLYSANPRDLAIDALEHVRDRLAAAREIQAAAADLLQQDKAAEALAQVGEANDAWIQAYRAVLLAADAGGIDLNTLRVGGDPASSCVIDLVRSLTGLKETLTHHDTVALADALAYEWPGTTDRWDALVAAMVDELERGERH